jgi:hypothetical protein
MTTANATTHAPEWFGAAARSNAFFPILMGAYLMFYAASWPFAWGWIGALGLVTAVASGAVSVVRGVRQVRHAARFEALPSPENARIDAAMARLNGVTHPVWIVGSIVLLLTGHGRFVPPLMVFVIGAHFLPMARILGRRIDLLLGPVAMAFAVWAAVLALDPSVGWLTVFAVAGVGGALSTGAYAVYMTRAYRRMCERAEVPFPLSRPSA